MINLYKQLFDQVEDEFAMLEKGKDAAQNDKEQLKRTAASFITLPVEHHDPSRNKSAVGFIAATTGAIVLVLGAPTKDAAYSALSNSGLCIDNKDLKMIVNAIMATQQQFQELLQRVQEKWWNFLSPCQRSKENTRKRQEDNRSCW